MSYDQDIANIQARIAKAESDQGTWRTSGNQEKYLESISLADALEIELDLLRKQRFEANARSAQFQVPPPAARARGAPYEAGERALLMAEHSITQSGQQYQYSKYRYDRFEDALGYAVKQRVAPSACDADDSLPPSRAVEVQNEAQRRQMAALGITFDGSAYHLGPYRYERLEDAIDYAGLDPARGPIPKSSLS